MRDSSRLLPSRNPYQGKQTGAEQPDCRGQWDGRQILSQSWVDTSTRDHERNIYGRYSYGYQWYLTYVDGEPAFLASGFGGQIIGVVPSLDLVVVLKYEAENAVHPEPGTAHDDMELFELVVKAVER